MSVLENARGLVLENFNLKLISFVFALVLYALVHGSTQEAQRAVYVDLVALVPPDSANRVLVSQLPARIKLTVRGPRTSLDELRSDDIGNLQLDLRSGNERRILLDPKMVHLPTGVRVEQIDPPVLDLHWEDQVVRDLPAQVSLVGTPAPGFIVRGVPVPEPRAIRVRGPKSDVMALQHSRIEAFDVTGLTEGMHTRTLKLDRPEPRLDWETETVRVTVEVSREISERPFTKVPVAVVGPPKAKTQPAEVDVRLACPPDILRSLRAEQVVPRVEVANPPPSGSLALPVRVFVDKCEAVVIPSTVVVKW